MFLIPGGDGRVSNGCREFVKMSGFSSQFMGSGSDSKHLPRPRPWSCSIQGLPASVNLCSLTEGGSLNSGHQPLSQARGHDFNSNYGFADPSSGSSHRFDPIYPTEPQACPILLYFTNLLGSELGLPSECSFQLNKHSLSFQESCSLCLQGTFNFVVKIRHFHKNQNVGCGVSADGEAKYCWS